MKYTALAGLDKISYSATNCPEVTDTYAGGDVYFANCVT